MIIKPISEYCSKSNKGRKKRPAEHIVYVVRPVGDRWHKIGRTKNMGNRLITYESNSGRDFEVRMQVVLNSEDDAKALEREFIGALTGRYEGRKKEWFLMLEYDLLAEAKEILSATKVAVKEVRGTASHNTPEWDMHRAMVRDVSLGVYSRLP